MLATCVRRARAVFGILGPREMHEMVVRSTQALSNITSLMRISGLIWARLGPQLSVSTHHGGPAGPHTKKNGPHTGK